MKKIFSLLLAFMMVMSLAACGGNTDTPATSEDPETSSSDVTNPSETPETTETPDMAEEPVSNVLEADGEYSITDYMDFKLVKIETVDKIAAALGGMMSYSPSDGNVYADIVIDTTITSANAIDSDKLLTGIATGGSTGATYDHVNVFVETGSDIQQYEPLNPLTTQRLHIAFAVPASETSLDIKLDINGTEFTTEYVMNQKIANTPYIALNDTIENTDISTIVFTKAEYTGNLVPSNTSGFYTHYEVESPDNTFLALHFDVTNLQADAKDVETFLSAKVTYMNKYNYTGFVVAEEADGTGYNNYDEIAPLAKRHIVVLIEVPKTVVAHPAAITMNLGGAEYAFVKEA